MIELSLTVFVGSRGDLQEERRAVVAAIEESGHRADAFENWAALPRPPLEASIGAVERADIVVLLLGSTYGPPASTGRSIIHEEYRAARAKEIPVLAFWIGTDDPEPRQSEFISEVRGQQTIRTVTSIDGLKQDVKQAIRAEVVQRFRAPQRDSAIASRMPEMGLTAERRLSITVDVQAETIVNLRDALTRQIGTKLNDVRAAFRAGRTSDAIAMIDVLRAEPEWHRVDAALRARVLTTLAIFHRASGRRPAEAESLVNEAKEIDPHADYTYFDALKRYETDGAERALELLADVRDTRVLNLKLALLLDLGRIDEAARILDQFSEPDVETERLRAFVELAKGNAESAVGILERALQAESQSESLRLAAATVNIASAIAAEERPVHPSPWLPPIDPGFVLATPAMLVRLENAAATLDEIIRTTQRTGEPLEQMRAWRLAAVALHPKRQDEASAIATEMLAADGSSPAALIWSNALGIDVDVERTEESLSTHASLTPSRVIAVVATIDHSGDPARAEAILDSRRAIFDRDEDLWRFWKVQLMVHSGEFDGADSLAERISASELRHAADLTISQARAKATGEWDEFVAMADRLDPGYGALVARARLGRWDEIVQRALILADQAPSPATIKLAATAAFRLHRNAESLQILRRHEDLWSRSVHASDLRRLMVQNQIAVGDLADALDEAERLFGATNAVYDLVLVIHAAMWAGRRKEARFWASRLCEFQDPDVRAEDFLQIAQMIALEDRDLARELWKRAEKASFATRLLPVAMRLAMSFGLNEEAQRVAESAFAAGLLREATIDDLVAAQNARAEALSDTVRSYASGDVPLSILLTATGRPLAEVYEMQLSAGRRTPVGSTPPLYIRHGGRLLNAHISLRRVRTLTLDVSTILIADTFGVLDAIEKRFETLRISAVTCAALAEQQNHLQSSQPSVDKAFAEVLRLFDEKRLSELTSGTAKQAANDNGGHFIGEVSDLAKAPPGAKLYLTPVAAFDLALGKELEHLVNERVVIVEAEAISIARNQVEERRRRDELATRLAKLAEHIGTGLTAKKYRVFATTQPDRAEPELDLTVHALTDFFRASGEPRHVFVVDDRFASAQLMLNGSSVVTFLNVLAELRARKRLPDDDYFQILLHLRRANFRFIDLDADEIVHWLTKAKVTGQNLEESEPLQILRVYLNAALSDRNIRIIPLPQTNPQGRAFGEGAFAINSSFATARALFEIWSRSNATVAQRAAMSDWIVRSLYTGTYGVHHLYGAGFNAARVLMSEDVAGLLAAFFDFRKLSTFVLPHPLVLRASTSPKTNSGQQSKNYARKARSLCAP
jgi:tetratricopeptide (TPR) repeat protein